MRSIQTLKLPHTAVSQGVGSTPHTPEATISSCCGRRRPRHAPSHLRLHRHVRVLLSAMHISHIGGVYSVATSTMYRLVIRAAVFVNLGLCRARSVKPRTRRTTTVVVSTPRLASANSHACCCCLLRPRYARIPKTIRMPHNAADQQLVLSCRRRSRHVCAHDAPSHLSMASVRRASMPCAVKCRGAMRDAPMHASHRATDAEGQRAPPPGVHVF